MDVNRQDNVWTFQIRNDGLILLVNEEAWDTIQVIKPTINDKAFKKVQELKTDNKEIYQICQSQYDEETLYIHAFVGWK